MKKSKISILLAVIFLFSLFSTTAFAINDDSVLSQHIKEADGTSGQDTNTGSGIKTGHIQDGAVTDAKITGPISTSKIEKPANVIVVAKSGGDFTSIQTAIDSINPTADNPYLIKVMPGTYVENIIMKSYVHLEGAGEDVTTIQASSTSNDVITCSNLSNAAISNVTIRGGRYGIVSGKSSIVISGNSIRENISGMHVFDWPNPPTSNVSINGNLVTLNTNVGIDVFSSSPVITNNVIKENGYGVGVAISDIDCNPTITNNIITGHSFIGLLSACSSTVIHNKIIDNVGGDIQIPSGYGTPNISFNIYDTLIGTDGVGKYNIKSNGTDAPQP